MKHPDRRVSKKKRLHTLHGPADVGEAYDGSVAAASRSSARFVLHSLLQTLLKRTRSPRPPVRRPAFTWMFNRSGCLLMRIRKIPEKDNFRNCDTGETKRNPRVRLWKERHAFSRTATGHRYVRGRGRRRACDRGTSQGGCCDPGTQSLRSAGPAAMRQSPRRTRRPCEGTQC